MKAEKLAGMIAIAFAMSAMAVVASALPSFASGRYDSHKIMSFNICHCATNYTLSVTDEEVRRTAVLISSVAPNSRGGSPRGLNRPILVALFVSLA